MEVGAVKQAFNNEVIQLKRNFNQARIQTIHKLTRKAKTFAGKKAPEKLKEKLKRKAESAVNEVLIMKKVKPKDIAKFAVTHTGNLEDYLNKPIVDHDKVCARLLLHKSLQGKYTFIRNTFSNIPINDLLMSRLERRKMKKEAQEKQKMKRDKKQKMVNTEGEWDVENLKSIKNNTKTTSVDELSDVDESIESNEEANSEDDRAYSDDEEIGDKERLKLNTEEESGESDEEVDTKMKTDQESDGDEDRSKSDIEEENGESDEKLESETENDQETNDDENLPEEQSDDDEIGKFVRPSSIKVDVKPKVEPIFKQYTKNTNTTLALAEVGKINDKPEMKKPSKSKDANKNKNLKEKLLSRKFKKDESESQAQKTKIVDPFFKTSTGDSYMSVVEPRQADEVKEIHKQGNRKLRRAAMFGHVQKIKPRQDFRQNNRRNDSQGGYGNNRQEYGNYKNNFKRNDTQFKDRNDSQFKGGNDSQFKGRNDNQFKGRSDFKFQERNKDRREPKEEKLHPSWEAKKKQSGILPFQGKKIVFDES